mmetsp:Transcript_4329/g.12654  ORF Transcript_4329/g.12654 Transcript_4329/m.12654 type:complete len:215 (+) Transcript_4329:334-978(+)
MLLPDLLLLLGDILLARLLLALDFQELQLGHALFVQRCFPALVLASELAQWQAALAAKAENLTVRSLMCAKPPGQLALCQRPAGLPLPPALAAVALADGCVGARLCLCSAADVAVPSSVLCVGAIVPGVILLCLPLGHTCIDGLSPRTGTPLHILQGGRASGLPCCRRHPESLPRIPGHVLAIAHRNSEGDGAHSRLPRVLGGGAHLELFQALS